MHHYTNRRNPILPLKYHIPDCEAHVMPDGKLYLYGSYDNREDVYCSEEYYVVSTQDLMHWTIHEKSLEGKNVPWFNNPDVFKYPGIDWTNPTPFVKKMMSAMEGESGEDTKTKFEQWEENPPALLFAPDCIHKEGKYYLYFCMKDDSEGVAVSDRPEGPFENPVQLPCGGIDPAIFMDEDSQVYYYWGQLYSHGVKLNQDMCSFNSDDIVDALVTEEEHYFHEGSSMRKYRDTYYYVYSDMERGKPTSIGYSTGKTPLGPFTYQGIIIDNDGCDPESWNNHGSIECVNGQWYIFYHRCSRGSQLHRRLCVEKIEIDENGLIAEVRMTSQGIGEPFSPGEKLMGYQACGISGSVYIGADEQYEEKLMNISDGDMAVFRYLKSETAWSEISVTFSGRGKIKVFFDEYMAGTVDAVGDGSICRVKAPIQMPAGQYELRLEFERADELEIIDVTLL